MLLILVACSGRPAATTPAPETSPTATLVETRTAEQRAAELESVEAAEVVEAPGAVEAVEVPAEFAAIRSLLMAHHTEDLPTREALEKHPDPVAALSWLAENDELMVVRTRATELLALFEPQPVD